MITPPLRHFHDFFSSFRFGFHAAITLSLLLRHLTLPPLTPRHAMR